MIARGLKIDSFAPPNRDVADGLYDLDQQIISNVWNRHIYASNLVLNIEVICSIHLKDFHCIDSIKFINQSTIVECHLIFHY